MLGVHPDSTRHAAHVCAETAEKKNRNERKGNTKFARNSGAMSVRMIRVKRVCELNVRFAAVCASGQEPCVAGMLFVCRGTTADTNGNGVPNRDYA